jgi:hypothetical protein
MLELLMAANNAMQIPSISLKLLDHVPILHRFDPLKTNTLIGVENE